MSGGAGTIIAVLLAGCLFTVVIGVIGYAWKMHQIEKEGWRLFAQRHDLNHEQSGAMGLGELSGIHRGRVLKISPVYRTARVYRRLNISGVQVELSLHSVLSALNFRAEDEVDRLALLGSREVQIGDAQLDPLLRLMGVDAGRYRQLLFRPEIRTRILRAFDSSGVLIVRDGVLKLARDGQDASTMDRLLTEAMDLADALEHGDGLGWTQAAEAFGLELTRESTVWKLCSPETPSQVEVEYRVGDPSRSHARVVLDDSLGSLVIKARDPESPGIRTGDPILDAHVHISGVDLPGVLAWCARDGFTEGVIHLVKGLNGTIVGGLIQVVEDGLMLKPGDVLEDLKGLREILRGPDNSLVENG